MGACSITLTRIAASREDSGVDGRLEVSEPVEATTLRASQCSLAARASTAGRIVHRDVSPQNVLVTYDDEGNAEPRVPFLVRVERSPEAGPTIEAAN